MKQEKLTIAGVMFYGKSDFARRLLKWYRRGRRDLPWRLPKQAQNLRSSRAGATRLRPDPYHVFVSEAMLQQTQVVTVIPYFNRFIERFPTFAALAAADEQDVLRLWQGLGYYSRARNLRQAAITVALEHAGQLPGGVDELLALPGIGRYTAGAIASIAFGARAPIVDGNVARVLCRLDKIQSDPREPLTRELLWTRAADILPQGRGAAGQMGDFNSALMELGATLCTPRKPRCLTCPVQLHCEAYAAGLQESIPLPRRTKPTPLLERWTFCIHRRRAGKEQWLIEQRPATGRWAGMWQFLTLTENTPGRLPIRVASTRSIGEVSHALTHRRYQIHVNVCAAMRPGRIAGDSVRAWVTLKKLNAFPLPRPHVRIAAMLASWDEHS